MKSYNFRVFNGVSGLQVSPFFVIFSTKFHILRPFSPHSMLFGKRLRQFRLAKGLSLDALAGAMGDVVTKQSLSKYERGASLPSQIVLEKLAEALDVRIASLNHRPVVEVEILEYRRRSRLSKREQHRIESLSQCALEERIRLLDKLGAFDGTETPLKPTAVNSLQESETAADELRDQWKLDKDPIPNMVALLESKQIHVVEIDGAESFDGLSLRIVNNEGSPVSFGVVTRRGISGERQRLNLAHELGHLMLDVGPGVDGEKAAFRFGAAFLAPAEALFRDIGRYRKFISLQELLLLKRRYKMSIQALLYRLRELDVINAHVYKRWFILLGKKGWRKEEPQSLDPERLEWLHLIVYGAILKGLLSEHDAKQILCLGQSDDTHVVLTELQQFVNRSNSERHELLTHQMEDL